MHIVYLCDEYPPASHGGIGTFVHEMAHALVARGHQVSVVGVYRRADDVIENDGAIRVYRLAPSPTQPLRFYRNRRRFQLTLNEIQRQQPITLLEGNENSFAFLDRSSAAPYVLRMQGGHHFFYTELGLKPRPLRSLIERVSFRRATHFCAVSRFVAERTRSLLRLGDDVPIALLPNPVDVERFSPRADIAPEADRILFVGTITEKKGVRQLIQAMPLIIKAVPDAHLHLIGRDSTDPSTGASYIETLKRMIAPEVKDQIVFRSALPNDQIPAEIARASVCAYPSHMESQGIVLIEGMAMGRPVVASKLGPSPEIIEDGVSGLLCDPHDPADIARALICILNDAELGRRLGIAARQRAVEAFALDSVVERNLAFYQSCLT
jgi:glycosyltransferase involved in cell wall biosynthesis